MSRYQLARDRAERAERMLAEEQKSHEATRAVLRDLVLERGGSDATLAYLERRDVVMEVLRSAPCYCMSSAHGRNCRAQSLVWDLSTEAERQTIIDGHHEWALKEMRADQRDTLAERILGSMWEAAPSMVVNHRDYRQIQTALQGLDTWLPPNAITDVPGNPAADGSESETKPEGE